MFERDTSMRYEDVPNAPTDQEKSRITAQLMGYLMAACPQQRSLQTAEEHRDA